MIKVVCQYHVWITTIFCVNTIIYFLFYCISSFICLCVSILFVYYCWYFISLLTQYLRPCLSLLMLKSTSSPLYISDAPPLSVYAPLPFSLFFYPSHVSYFWGGNRSHMVLLEIWYFVVVSIFSYTTNQRSFHNLISCSMRKNGRLGTHFLPHWNNAVLHVCISLPCIYYYFVCFKLLFFRVGG